MKPQIEKTTFGSITIDGQNYGYDILIHLDGTISKRKNKLSKAVYGTSHNHLTPEAEPIYEESAEQLLSGNRSRFAIITAASGLPAAA